MKKCNPTPKTRLFLVMVIFSLSSFRVHASIRISTSSIIAHSRSMEKNRQASAEAEAKKAEMRMIVATASSIYDEMDLEDSGLSRKAFMYAWTGYYKLKKKGLLRKTNILSICDFSQSSSNQRLYVIDVRNRRMLYRTFVAHGINSGEEYATSFSNQMESCKSSLGFYVTTGTYTGINGISLRINGVDQGFNNNALKRAVVIHGAGYVSKRILKKYGVMGTTFGCPAIPTEMTTQIIPVVKNGSCWFIYYPSKKYLSQSRVLNS
ncbi:murein L,D-transpeptidase catalytic domain family protein [Puia sp.]|uniref:murein L,D-transpeptidase catalytic domain family protein n=1 Tax=Puia sp. TaxID=2045100 RepID=UPI002F3EA74A